MEILKDCPHFLIMPKRCLENKFLMNYGEKGMVPTVGSRGTNYSEV